MDVAAELRALAANAASGSLTITGSEATGRILFRDGRICTVEHSGSRPALGMRLVSGGSLSLTNLGSALAVQQQHPQMRLGDVLVRMGLVQRQDVEAVAWGQLCDDVASMLRWNDATCTFSPIAPDSLPPAGPRVEDVLSAAAERVTQWHDVVRRIGGPDTVPSLNDACLSAKDTALRPTDWAVLCRVDGHRSLQSIADQAGYSVLEAASILEGLLAAGLVCVPETHLPPTTDRPAPWPPAEHQEPVGTPAPIPVPPPPLPSDDEFDDAADLLRELSQLGGLNASAPRRR
jgi:hypothetical protein